jgi:hypothetical protein
MQGMSEREYAARAGLSRGAIQKAKAAGRLVLHADGSIDPDASDARRAAATDPSKQRAAAQRAPALKLKPVPNAAISAVGDTLREHGLPPPATGGATFPAGENRQRGAEVAGAAPEAAEAEGRAG